jgi:hypothetical protein
MRRSIVTMGTAALAASVLGAGPALAGTGWSVVSVPPVGAGGTVTGISAPTDTDAWAVGDAGTAAFIDHWNGTMWSPTTVPTFPCTSTRCFVHLFQVSASATDAWVLGDYSPKPGYEHYFTLAWNGSAWATDDNVGTQVDDVSATDAVAADGYQIGEWNGSSWTGVVPPNPPGPSEGDLTSVSATSTSDVWAVGTYDPAYSSQSYDNYSVYWNGSTWTEVPMPLPVSSDPLFDYQINQIDAISPSNVWAVGESGDNVADYFSSGGAGTPAELLIEHYNGTAWSIVSDSGPGAASALTSVTATSAGDVWAVGHQTPAGGGGDQTLIENWNGTAWTAVTSPDEGTTATLSSVSTSLGAAIVWAAGGYNNGSAASSNPLVLQNG